MFFPTNNKPHVVLNHFLGLSNFPRCCAWLVKAWHWRFPAPSWPMSCDGWSWKNFQRRKAQSSSCTICTRSCCWAKACKNKGFWVKLRRCPAPMILGSERCFFVFSNVFCMLSKNMWNRHANVAPKIPGSIESLRCMAVCPLLRLLRRPLLGAGFGVGGSYTSERCNIFSVFISFAPDPSKFDFRSLVQP